ncbi:dihydroflavonol-4-reductase [Nitrospirillum amazonense]|uniref:Dihydroflavonol-4-reductase n=1 Tax=Nitrospirillum amazonense TaxID=28077 RepID=A0A560FJN1_9PROT|nr:NAD-dependent epimerase/dehydratase family protein [Nitrospirillum amazonense]TWB21824.1 dihydroflavonol-4-reductase [Nitrospirillum amazonense]
MSKILVTGGSGFLAGHCIAAALAAGHEVRTTLRNLDKAPQVRAMMAVAGADTGHRLTFHAADLGHDDGWGAAAAGCDYVLHTASPFPPVQPEDPNDLIIPARDGTLRVLRAAGRAAVRRVVLTSSFAAVGYGPALASHVYTEDDWTPVDAPNQPYILSKTIAERAAWDFVGKGGAPELSVVNPTGIFGPALGPQLSTSMTIIKGLLDGAFPPELPDMWFGVVDVRDAADLHLRAMTQPAAAGERFIAVSGEPVSLLEVATILRERLGGLAARVPNRGAPLFPNANRRRSSSAKARQTLGWSPRPGGEAIIAGAESLLRLKLLQTLD